MIFQEKYSTCYLLLTDQISLSDCLYFLRYWSIFVFQLFGNQAVTLIFNNFFLIKSMTKNKRNVCTSCNPPAPRPPPPLPPCSSYPIFLPPSSWSCKAIISAGNLFTFWMISSGNWCCLIVSSNSECKTEILF